MLLLKKKIPIKFGHPIKPVVQSSEWQLDPTFPFPLGSSALSGIRTHCKNVLKWTNLWRVLVLFWFAFSLHSGNFSSAASFRWQDICEHMQIGQSLNFRGLFLGLRWLIVEVGVDEKQVRALPLSPQAASSTTHWAKAILNPIPSSAPLAHHSLSFQAFSSLPSASRDPSPSVCLTFPENAQIWKV